MPTSWEGGEYRDAFGKAGAGFIPPKEEWVETNPDRRRSSSRMVAVDLGSESVWLMEVRGLGVISMRATTEPLGTYVFHGLSTFTDQMLQFGLDAEKPHAF